MIPPQNDYWVTTADICGFCGLAGSCESSVSLNRKIEKVVSTCFHASKKDANLKEVDVAVKRARVSLDMTPCTNMSLECKLWSSHKQTVYMWKYCMPAHLR